MRGKLCGRIHHNNKHFQKLGISSSNQPPIVSCMPRGVAVPGIQAGSWNGVTHPEGQDFTRHSPGAPKVWRTRCEFHPGVTQLKEFFHS